MEVLLRAERLTHVYETRGGEQLRALDCVDLEIGAGEFVAIVGRNGSGKSTLAKHFNALLLPTEGRVLVAGLDTAVPEHLWTVRQMVGMVFQNPDNQIVATTVEEDVAFGPENLGLPPAEIAVRVEEALQAVDMEAYRKHAPHHLSGGQKQRVAIAGVIAMRPRCIVLDEPTAMLDPGGRREVLSTIGRLNREEGHTVVLITHFMEEAAQAGRVVVMEGGRIVLQGPPRQVFQETERLRALHLDIPPVTQLAGRLRAAGWPVPGDALTVEELVEAIAGAWAGRGRGRVAEQGGKTVEQGRLL
ncbi:MAG: energy-coupling factor transporter ATPase [Bacillota bacterium]|nr:energy-coupling factor transporter ATPase [Bacillota bacterium]